MAECSGSQCVMNPVVSKLKIEKSNARSMRYRLRPSPFSIDVVFFCKQLMFCPSVTESNISFQF